ncbi:hypothetical protein T12_335 [Trichinella patagoniensis]|uniref:Uncharacterized protein n=1 Tax=Trichinella patagoniensis TaxID=990121 RepID=A0A0V0ZR11_9BILA|nr:hypothetical protein T12_335 [Trichinella patagoniensis]
MNVMFHHELFLSSTLSLTIHVLGNNSQLLTQILSINSIGFCLSTVTSANNVISHIMSFAAHWQRHILPRLLAVPSAHFDSHAKKGVQGSLFYLRLLFHHGKELFHLVGKQTDKGLSFRSCFLRNSNNLSFYQLRAYFRGRPRDSNPDMKTQHNPWQVDSNPDMKTQHNPWQVDSNPDMKTQHNPWQVVRLRHVHCPDEMKNKFYLKEKQYINYTQQNKYSWNFSS